MAPEKFVPNKDFKDDDDEDDDDDDDRKGEGDPRADVNGRVSDDGEAPAPVMQRIQEGGAAGGFIPRGGKPAPTGANASGTNIGEANSQKSTPRIGRPSKDVPPSPPVARASGEGRSKAGAVPGGFQKTPSPVPERPGGPTHLPGQAPPGASGGGAEELPLVSAR